MSRKNTGKRMIAALLALLFLIALVPAEASAATPAFARADNACYSAMLNRQEKVDVKGMGITLSNVDAFLDEFRENHPDLFYGSPSFYNYNSNTGDITSFTLFFDANVSTAEILAYETVVSNILAGVRNGWTDVQKLLYFHDYLATHIEYDKRLYDGTMPNESYNNFGALVRGTAVCNGYALAMCDLCNRVGIPCRMIDSDPMNHAWNVVQIGGSWYHLDVTWDDPTDDVLGNVKHTFFLLSDAAMRTADSGNGNKHYSWNAVVTCSDTRYDSGAYWSNAVSAILQDDAGNAYYIRNDGTSPVTVDGRKYTNSPVMSFVRRNLSTGAETVLKTVNDFWPSWQSQSYYTAPYMKLAKVGEYYYFNDARTIYCYHPNGKEIAEFHADTSTGYLYGLAESGGKLLCSLATTPKESGTKYNVPMDKFRPELNTSSQTTTTVTQPPKELDPVYVTPNAGTIDPRYAVDVTVADFPVTLNGRVMNNRYGAYPSIVYNQITYFPMTYYDCRFLKLETAFTDTSTGLFINKIAQQGPYCPMLQYTPNGTGTYKAQIVTFPVTVNGKVIDNVHEQYPLLVFREVTYFPMTWRFGVDEFGWNYYYSNETGLVISVN